MSHEEENTIVFNHCETVDNMFANTVTTQLQKTVNKNLRNSLS